MNRLSKFVAGAGLALSLIAAPVAVQAQAYPAMPAIAAPKPFSLPRTETYTLSNGLKVTLIPYSITPKTTISLRVGAGGINEGENTWLAGVTADMLREGAGERDAAALAEAVAGMGGGLQTGATPYQTQVAVDVLSEHAADAIALVADVARRPTFPESSFQRVMQNRQRIVAVALSGPSGQAESVLARTLYGTEHPYGRLFPTPQQLGGYTLQQVRDFHAANYGAAGSHLYVAGQFDAQALKAAIERAFGDWARGPDPLRIPVTQSAGPRVLLVDKPGAAQSTLRFAFPAPAPGQAGDIETRVTNVLLGGSFNSRITKNIREAKGYTYSPQMLLVQRDPNETQWVLNADVTTNVTGPAVKEVLYEITRLAGEAPSAAERTGATSYLAGQFIFQNATAGGVLNSIANRDLFGLPPTWLDTYVPSVLEVTADQMQARAAQTLPLDKLTLVVVGDLATVRPQLEALPELQGVPMTVVTPGG